MTAVHRGFFFGRKETFHARTRSQSQPGRDARSGPSATAGHRQARDAYGSAALLPTGSRPRCGRRQPSNFNHAANGGDPEEPPDAGVFTAPPERRSYSIHTRFAAGHPASDGRSTLRHRRRWRRRDGWSDGGSPSPSIRTSSSSCRWSPRCLNPSTFNLSPESRRSLADGNGTSMKALADSRK